MRHVTFRQLQSLLAIKRSGKISQAAQELNLTGPAITLQLKQLEEQLGLPLFDRSREGMRPTVAGDAALRAARDIELRLRSFFEEVDAIRDADTGRLANCAVSTAKYFAPALIAAFRANHPGIEIVLSVGNRFGIIDALRQYDIDLALMGRPPRDFGVRSLLFGDHPLVMIAAPDHPLTRRRSLSKEDLLDHKFIVREAGSGTRSSLDIFMSDVSGWQELRHTEMTSNETIKQAVMAGMGIAFISAHTIAMELELGRLKILDVEGMPIRRQWYGVTRSDREANPAMRAFNEFLVAEGARYLPFIPTIYPMQPDEG